MKRNPKFNGLVISIALSAVLAGCGSSTNSLNLDKDDAKKDDINKNIKAVSMNGKAIDGYLQGATVCLDLNKDGYCQSNEPMSKTKVDGSFKLDISPEIQNSDSFHEAMLLVYGGIDKDAATAFRGKLLAPQNDEKVNISPITTLVAKAVQKELKEGKKLSKKEMKEKVDASKKQVAKVFGLKVEDLTKDPVAEKDNNPKLIKEALKIQKAVEAMSISGDNDALEEVYEKLAAKLIEVDLEILELDKGMMALLDKTFEDDDKLQTAKDIGENIEKAFEKLDGDLEKIAFLTKKDMKKIEQNQFVKREDTDDLFKDDIVWEDEYIKADLEEIGISNPSNEDIESLKHKMGDIKPGTLFDKKDEFKDSDDANFKEIFKKIEKKELKKEKKEKLQDALKNEKILKFKDGEPFYSIQAHNHYGLEIEYDEVVFDSGKINFQEFDFKFDKGVFEEDTYQDEEFILKAGKWEKRSEGGILSYTENSDGSIIIDEENLQVTLTKENDIKSLSLPELDMKIPMPTGAKEMYLKFKQIEDVYKLDDGQMKVNSISEYVSHECNNEYFLSTDGKMCDTATTDGKTKEGQKWQIKDVNGVKILEVQRRDRKDKSTIYSAVDGLLYEGSVKKVGVEQVQMNYNKVAMDAIKSAVANAWEEKKFEKPVPTTKDKPNINESKIDRELKPEWSFDNNILTVVFNKDMNPTPIGIWKDSKTVTMNFPENNTEKQMVFKAYNFQTTEGKYLAEDLKVNLLVVSDGYDVSTEEKVTTDIDNLNSDIRNKFVGQYISFQMGSYMRNMVFHNDNIDFLTFDGHKGLGKWEVMDKTIIINTVNGETIVITFEKTFKDGPYYDLQEGDKATYSIKSKVTGFTDKNGELTVRTTAM